VSLASTLRAVRCLTLFSAGLQLKRDGTLLGTALMPNLTLKMGDNNVTASSNFEVRLAMISFLAFLIEIFRRTIAHKGFKLSTTLLARRVSDKLMVHDERLAEHTTDVQLTISGYDGSTEILSLAQAFKSLDLDVVLPGLKTNLLKTAALTSKLKRLSFYTPSHEWLESYHPRERKTTLAMSPYPFPTHSALALR